MAKFLPPPCCACRLKFSNCDNFKYALCQKITNSYLDLHRVSIESLFPDILWNFINYMSSNSDMDLKIPFMYANCLPETVKESNIKWSIFKILKQAYEENPTISVDELKKIQDVLPILKENLDKIKQQFLKNAKNPLDIFNGKATYQRFFIECLLFASKLASKCFKTFKSEKNTIFEKIIDHLDSFFLEQHIYEWIQHDAQIMEPFGKTKFSNVLFGDFSSSSDEEELDEEII